MSWPTPAAAIALPLLRRFEDLRLHAYPDPHTHGDPHTIGFGHTSKGGPPHVTPGMVITASEAEAILNEDLARVIRSLEGSLGDTWSAMNDNMQAALASLVFNKGLAGTKRTPVWPAILKHDFVTAADEIEKIQDFAPASRRAEEAALFRTHAEEGAGVFGLVIMLGAAGWWIYSRRPLPRPEPVLKKRRVQVRRRTS